MKANASIVLTVIAALSSSAGHAQAPTTQPASTQGVRPPDATYKRNPEVGWPLAPSEKEYAAIDGEKLKGLVDELTAISRRYRDNGHPQFWGRIMGTSADADNAQWMLEKFRQLGLSGVRQETIDLAPSWMPQSWSVTAVSKGTTLSLDTAQPTYGAVGTPAGGLDLEAVWVGLGSEAEIRLARDVKGKAVFLYSTDIASRHAPVADNAIKRLAERGAAAIFVIQGLPGNLRLQFYPVDSPVPTFSLGQRDGFAMRDMIGTAGDTAPRVKIRLDVNMTGGLRSSTVMASLPGTTDETIIVVAHRDAWFEGANDNAAGVATMIGLAEYFAKMPKERRRRTIQFFGLPGHHNLTGNAAVEGQSGTWLAEHPEVFEKAGLLINCEHTGSVATILSGAAIRPTNAAGPATWFAGGPKLAEIMIRALDAFGVVTYLESSPAPAGEIMRYYRFAPGMQLFTGSYTFHSDQETAATVSATGLAAVTRAYAKVMFDTNAVELKVLRQSIKP